MNQLNYLSLKFRWYLKRFVHGAGLFELILWASTWWFEKRSGHSDRHIVVMYHRWYTLKDTFWWCYYLISIISAYEFRDEYILHTTHFVRQSRLKENNFFVEFCFETYPDSRSQTEEINPNADLYSRLKFGLHDVTKQHKTVLTKVIKVIRRDTNFVQADIIQILESGQ